MMKKNLRKSKKSIEKKLPSIFLGAFVGMMILVVAMLMAIIIGILVQSEKNEENKKARIAAQYQTPMDEKYVGLRWVSEGGRRVEMYFDVIEEGEPPRGICVFDGMEYEVVLVGPFGPEGMSSRDYYVIIADTEITEEEPEVYLFEGSLSWEVNKSAFSYNFDDGEKHVTLVDFYPVKIPVEALDGA